MPFQPAQRERSRPKEAAAAAAEAVPLGINTSIVSPVAEQEKKARASRVLRYVLQSVAGRILSGERVSRCMRVIIPGESTVRVLFSEKFKRAHYGNLTVCGSVWSCPVCAAKITERRRLEVAPAVAAWAKDKGDLIAAAFTLQHTAEDSLKVTRELLASAYKKMQGGKSWILLKKRLGIMGAITSSEVTWGLINGWHPHKHALFFTDRRIEPEELEDIRLEISGKFESLLKHLGGYAHPDFGVKFDRVDTEEQQKYPFKWGIDSELTKGPVKKAREGGFSPFELLHWAAETGEYQPTALFREYYSVFKGTNQLNYTRGLREMLQLQEVEKSDQELATEQDQEAWLMAVLAREAWRIVCLVGKRGELLEVASSGDLDVLADYLKSLGVREVG